MVHVGPHRFYSTEETARLLNVNVRTVQRWLSDVASRPDPVRDLNPITTANGKRVFPADQIHAVVGRIYRIDFDAATAERILHNQPTA